jgi:hypothetical protein
LYSLLPETLVDSARYIKQKKYREVEKEERQRTLLEKLGFAQMMFDFYTAPME